LTLAVTASDPDLDLIALSTDTLPANASFVDNLDGTGDFEFIPDSTQTGIHNITFIASDAVLADSELVSITVSPAGNRAPTIVEPPGEQKAVVGETLELTIVSEDPDGTIPELFARSLPPNASFVDNGDGTGSFEFTPDSVELYKTVDFIFIASDGFLADTALVSIDVVLTTGGIAERSVSTSLSLSQNSPNPFSSTTVIQYCVPDYCHVQLRVFDQAGRMVATLVDESQSAGHYIVRWTGIDSFGTRVPSGVYFYKITADDQVSMKKMVVVN
jgi:hypothetical protein